MKMSEKKPGDVIKQRHLEQSRMGYLCGLLPEEMRNDPYVNAVAHAWLDRDDFSIEGCLVAMVRHLVERNNSLKDEFAKFAGLAARPRVVP